MEIGGKEFLIKGLRSKTSILEAIKGFWPHMVYDDTDIDCIMIYRDAEAESSWDTMGRTDENDSALISIGFETDEIFVLVDDKAILLPIVEAIRNLAPWV
jgi:hypothetical protein